MTNGLDFWRTERTVVLPTHRLVTAAGATLADSTSMRESGNEEGCERGGWLRRTGVDARMYNLNVNPPHLGRFEPRGVKRHNDKYTSITRPRHILREALTKQAREA
jgi:hypothetical protein